MRKVFLDDLPRWGKGGRGREGTINWNECLGMKVKFTYDTLEGEIELLECLPKHICVKYKNISAKLRKESLLNGQIGQILHYVGDIKIGGQKAIEGINDIPTTAPWMVKYFQGGYDEAKIYTYQSNKTVILVCPDCGRISSKKIKICNLYNQGFSCICQDGFSFGHKYIYSLLSQLNIKFNSNVRFDWCVFEDYDKKTRFGEYDFVIEDMKLIIEIDGAFHRIDNKMNGHSKEKSQYIDNMKDKLAEENNYEVVRIEYNDKKKEELKYNIQNSILASKFNLDNIDWERCLEFSFCNLSKIVADCWNNRKNNETTTELAKIFKICRHTITGYLKEWTEIEYCDYDGKKEGVNKYLKLSKINKERCSKTVNVYKDEALIGKYKSISELERKSYDDLGCQLQHANICKVLKGKRLHHKGFTFKYVD